MSINKECEAKIIYLLQRGLPLEPAPFAVLAEQLGNISENEVIGLVKKSLAEKTARCLRGVFNLPMLGYKSVLCAAAVPKEKLDRLSAQLIQDMAITHCYERSCNESPSLIPDAEIPPEEFPDLWFTCTVKNEEYEEKVDRLKQIINPHPLYFLPATCQFKIQVIFDTRRQEDKSDDQGTFSQNNDNQEKQIFSLPEQNLIRSLQDIFITRDPYADIAEKCSLSQDEVLRTLRTWRSKGILRRIGLIMYHRRIGFSANGMAVWRIPPDKAQIIGRQMANLKEITHCYERYAPEHFPYNVYAMIHAENWDILNRLFIDISRRFSLNRGLLLRSVHEYKKTSFQPFGS